MDELSQLLGQPSIGPDDIIIGREDDCGVAFNIPGEKGTVHGILWPDGRSELYFHGQDQSGPVRGEGNLLEMVRRKCRDTSRPIMDRTRYSEVA